MAKWWQYVLNPIGTLGADLVKNLQNNLESNGPKTEYGEGIEEAHPEYLNSNPKSSTLADLGDLVSKVYDDFTGVSQIKLQNELDRQMAEESYQRNLQSIGDTAAAYDAAGFNRNLMYSKDGVSYSAPQLQAYSGSKRLDTILSRVGKVLSSIPAIYQATAALEGIDQARERTKQAEIKTMADGLNLINQTYSHGDNWFSHPFSLDLDPSMFGGKRHVNFLSPGEFRPSALISDGYFTNNTFRRYADSTIRNKFDLLESIGLSNDLRKTKNSYMGYQYELDRRFGPAGRIVGMASQGLGAISKFKIPRKILGK